MLSCRKCKCKYFSNRSRTVKVQSLRYNDSGYVRHIINSKRFRCRLHVADLFTCDIGGNLPIFHQLPPATSTPLSLQLLLSIQIELLKDTVANHPPSDCSDSPRLRHHFSVILRACLLEQRCPVPLRAEYDCMVSCLASAVTSWVVKEMILIW